MPTIPDVDTSCDDIDEPRRMKRSFNVRRRDRNNRFGGIDFTTAEPQTSDEPPSESILRMSCPAMESYRKRHNVIYI